MFDSLRLTCMCMHVHAGAMRTTIEMTDEHRAALLEIAGKRGQKGFSEIIREALDLYLQGARQREERIARALRAQGALDDREAGEMRAAASEARALWRVEHRTDAESKRGRR